MQNGSETPASSMVDGKLSALENPELDRCVFRFNFPPFSEPPLLFPKVKFLQQYTSGKNRGLLIPNSKLIEK